MGAFDVGMIFFTEMKSILSLATEHMMNLLITINPFNRAQSPNGRHLCEASIRKKTWERKNAKDFTPWKQR